MTETEWFDTSGVVKNILGHCNGREIQNLSLVNKKWNCEARNLLKIRGRTVAIIGHRDRTDPSQALSSHPSNSIPGRRKSYACEHLFRFADMIQSMENDSIYSGLTISAKVSHCDPCPPIDESTILFIASRVPIKLLTMKTHRLHVYDRENRKELAKWEETECKAVKLLHLLLRQSSSQLVLFELAGGHGLFSNSDFIASTSDGFGGLEIFKLRITSHGGRRTETGPTFLKQILDTAPNLKEFHVTRRKGLLDTLRAVNAILGERTEIVVVIDSINLSIAKLFSSRVATNDHTFFTHERCQDGEDYKAIRAVLQNSRRILEKVELNFALLAEMLANGVPFLKLRRLTLKIDFSYLRRQLRGPLETILGRGCWGGCFPKLQEMCIFDTPDDRYSSAGHETPRSFFRRIRYTMDKKRLAEPENLHVRPKCLNLKLLHLRHPLQQNEMEFLTNFRVRRLCGYGLDHSYPRLLHSLETVEELSFSVGHESYRTVDAIFCGVHPEEVDALMDKDVEYLSTVHIVPVHPPLAALARKLGLRKLHIDASRHSHGVFSKVSEGICFSRMTNVAVEVTKMTEWFELSAVVRNILRHCHDSEIRKLSLLNKTWNREARNLLKIRGRTVAKIGHRNLPDPSQAFTSHPYPIPGRRKSYACEDLVRFAEMIRTTEGDLIFSGLKITTAVSHYDHCPPIDESTIQSIATTVPIKLLLIRIRRLSVYDPQAQKEVKKWGEVQCKAVKLLHLFLRQASHQLVRFDLIGWDLVPHSDFMTSISGGFDELQVFKFGVSFHDRQPNLADRALLRKIVQAAPNLKEFWAVENAGKNYWLWTFHKILGDNRSNAILVIYKFDVGVAKLYSSRLVQIHHTFWVSGRCRNSSDYEATRTVLRNSSKSLEKLTLPSALLAEMLLDGVPFDNVRDLAVRMNLSLLRLVHPKLLELIFGGKFWRRCFPELRYLAISATSEDKYPRFMEQIVNDIVNRRFADAEGEQAPPKIINLPTLYLPDPLKRNEMEFLADFRIRHLRGYELDQSYPWLLYGLKSLEELSFSLAPESCRHADAIFCGVPPQEVDELMEKDCEYLKAVHIVPIHPPVTWLGSMRKLSLYIERSNEGGNNGIFSKVSAGLCFSRMPALSIEVKNASRVQRDGTACSDLTKITREFQHLDLTFHAGRG